MRLTLFARPCPAGACLPLLPANADEGRAAPELAHRLESPRAPVRLSAGTLLCEEGDAERPWFQVTGSIWHPAQAPDAGAGHAVCCPLLRALQAVEPRADTPATGSGRGDPSGRGLLLTLETARTGWSLAWITLSDKGARGERVDTAGPAVADVIAAALPLCHSRGFLLPDDEALLRGLLAELALVQEYDLICTVGGTGLSPRDTAPEATQRLFDRELPGFRQAMFSASLRATPHAALSRAAAGIVGRSIVLNLPGSVKGATENIRAVLGALPHALAKIHGDTTDCGA